MSDLKKAFGLLNRRIGQKIKTGERDVARKYAHLLTEIREKTAKLYERYEVDGVLTYAEAAKFDRLNKYMAEVQHLLKTHYADLNKVMPEILGDIYKDGYYLTAWAVESESKTLLRYSVASHEQITAMVNNPVSGLTLRDRLEWNRTNIIYTIQQEVSQGLRNGETYTTMAKRLKKTLEGDATKAMRIVRTEGHRVQESAKLEAVEHANKKGVIMVKTWNSMEDERVRRGTANHQNLNNKTIEIEKDFEDGLGKGKAPGQLGAAGSDINCRCFLTYEIVRVERKQHSNLETLTFDRWQKERLVA